MIDYTMCKYRYFLMEVRTKQAKRIARTLKKIIEGWYCEECDPVIIVHIADGAAWLYTVLPLDLRDKLCIRSLTNDLFSPFIKDEEI